jgi:hypothetical protein
LIILCPFITYITVDLLKGSKSVNFHLFMRYSCLLTINTCFTCFWYIAIHFHINPINIILYFSILLHCIVQWVLQVTIYVQLYCVSCHCLTLHVSAYMAIFRCVGYFYFICLKESASRVFCLFFFAKQIPSGIWKKNILHTWRWPCKPKHVV